MLTLKIDNISLPLEIIAGFSQEYKKRYNSTTHYTMSGNTKRQTTWSKLQTTISGNGWAPPALMNLDYDALHTIYCVAPLSMNSLTTSAVIPGNFRTDGAHAPSVHASVSGKLIKTEYTISGSDISIIPVVGADYYIISYIPILTVLIEPPSLSLDSNSVVYAWSMSVMEA